MYDFDKATDRHNTGSLKWDNCDTYDGIEVLPMWVADMDFESPKEIISAMAERVEHGIFGYTPVSESYYNAVIDWMKRRHNWEIMKDWIITLPGVVPAVSLAVLAFTGPGEKVVVQSPVYHPFYKNITDNGREVIENPLRQEGDRYVMDYQNLEEQIDDRVRMIILCSPHNPVGRVWEERELIRLTEICQENNILIVSDEIHSDLILEGYRHTPTAALPGEVSRNIVTCTSASKTFNLAGLGCANVIISNRDLFDQYSSLCKNLWIDKPNIFGLVGSEAGYRHGEGWLDQLLLYIKGNYDFLVSTVGEYLPEISITLLEGTYLAWLDFRETGLADKDLEGFLKREAKVWFDNGHKFGTGGEGFQRINLACPRKTLEEGLTRVIAAVKNWKQV